MDELEKIMKENKEMFGSQEPPSGHFERFEKRLQKSGRSRRISMVYRISRYAAVGLLLIMSSLWVYNELFDNSQQQMALREVSTEMADVEIHFTSQIGTVTEQIETLNTPEISDYKEEFMEEVEQMDSVYQQLQTELGANPEEERIVQAMIKYYKTKLHVVQNILKQLESFQELNNNKTDQNESVNF